MFGLVAAQPAACSGISYNLGTLGMPLLSKSIRKIKREKTMGRKQAQGYDAVPQNGSSPVMIKDVGDVFDLSAQLGHDGIVDDKIPLFPGDVIEIDGFKDLGIYFVHKRPPSVARIMFEPVEAVLFASRPLLPAFFTETVDRFDLEQRQNQHDKQQVVRTVAVFLDNVVAAQPCSEIQRAKGSVELNVGIIWTVYQIILNFSFKLDAIRGRHNERAPFLILYFVFGDLYISQIGVLFYL